MKGERANAAGTRAGRPLPVLGMQVRRRADGSTFFACTLAEDLPMPAGTELHLVRVRADGQGTGPTHALRVFPPSVAPSASERARASRDRLDGSGVRLDSRDGGAA